MTINNLGYNDSDSEAMQYFDHPSSIIYDDYLENEDERNELDVHILDAIKESLEEIDIKGKELFRKIISNVDVEIPLGRLAREAIGDSRAKDFLGKITKKVGKKMKPDEKYEDFVVSDRGASIDEEINDKLERFKVKTVNIVGVGGDDKK